METKDIILELRIKKGMSQEELAERVFVTRQAVSRWETGDTVPNTETLKLLSKLFDVSINTLLGSPRQLVCECCGMPIDDSNVSHEKMALLTRNTANGAMQTVNIPLTFLRNTESLVERGNLKSLSNSLYTNLIPCFILRAYPR